MDGKNYEPRQEVYPNGFPVLGTGEYQERSRKLRERIEDGDKEAVGLLEELDEIYNAFHPLSIFTADFRKSERLLSSFMGPVKLRRKKRELSGKVQD